MSRLRRFVVPFLIACIAMLALEAWIFLYQTDEGDLYAYQANAQYFNYDDVTLEDFYSDNTVEYPPLAVMLAVLTEDIAERLPDITGLPPQTYDPDEEMVDFNQFKIVYRMEMALVIFGTFLLLCRMLRAYLPDESPREWMARLGVFAIGLALMASLSLDRLDAMLGALILLALALMLGRRHYLWSFAVLAIAVAFKFVPIVLAPLWVIGSLPVETLAVKSPGGWRKLFLATAGRGALLAACIVLVFLPFVWLGGEDSLAFFTFHGDRGIEYGSTYAALLGVLKYTTGLHLTAPQSFGSHDIVSPLSPMLTHLAPVVVMAFFAAASLLLLANMIRAARTTDAVAQGGRVARVFGAEFILHAMLWMLIFIFANKVFSPQYLLWVLPLAPIVPLPGTTRKCFLTAFLALCLLTFLIYPCYAVDAMGTKIATDPNGIVVLSGPTRLGVLLLAMRAVLLAGMIAGLAIHLYRRLRPAKELEDEIADDGALNDLALDQG